MLHEFLSDNRAELIERCRTKVAMRRAPRATAQELSHGVPLFLEQLIEVFPHPPVRPDAANDAPDLLHRNQQIAQAAARHGQDLLKHDFSIEQVVHDYGDLCQAVTELAVERAAPITVQEFGSLNITLDNAIASAVASYSAGHETMLGTGTQLAAKERLGVLANAMRNLLNTAILAASALKRGSVGLGGATAAALDRSLIGMQGLIDRTLAEVRLESSPMEANEVIEIGPLIAAVQLAAVLEASSRQCEMTIMAEPDIFVRGDRHLLASAVANLLHGAVTSTHRGGEVFLNARALDARVIIDIKDAGSGPGSSVEAARRAVETNSGTLSVRALPEKGCVYTIDLPQAL